MAKGRFVVFYKGKDKREQVTLCHTEEEALHLVNPANEINAVHFIHLSGKVDHYALALEFGKVILQMLPRVVVNTPTVTDEQAEKISQNILTSTRLNGEDLV